MQMQDVIDFCEGRLSADKFYAELIGPEAESLFENSPPIPPYTKSHEHGMLYYYLIEQNYKNIGDLLDVQACLVQFLQKKEIPVTPSKEIDRLHSLMLKAEPPWLRVPGEYISSLLKDKEGTDKELASYLKEELKQKFKYLKKPPRWLQDALWPIHNGVPLLFIGQLDVSDLYHDHSQVYIFFDSRDKAYHEIVQSM